MIGSLHTLAVVIVLWAAVLLPGLLVLAPARLRWHAAPELRLPIAALASLLVLGAALTVQLALERSTRFMLLGEAVALVLLAACVGAWWALRRRRTQGAREAAAALSGAAVEAPPRLAMLDPRGGWLGDPWVLAIALGAGILGAVVQASSISDSLYHVAQAVKLAELPHPSFDNTGQYVDGSAHPGYLVPVGQYLVALVSIVAHADPLRVSALLPTIVGPLAVLAAAGAARALYGGVHAARIAGLAWIGIWQLGTWPKFLPMLSASQPGELVLDVAFPVVLGAVMLFIWSSDPDARRIGLVGLVLGVVVTAVLHISYLAFLGIGLAGYFVVAAVVGAARRDLPWKRHVIAGLVLLVAAAAPSAAMLPRINALDTYKQDPTEQITAAADAPDRPEAARLGELITGSPDEYRLRADYLVWSGGGALIGLLGCLLVLPLLRTPGAMLVGGSSIALLIVSQSSPLFTELTGIIGPGQSRRFDTVLPLALGATGLLVAAWGALEGRGGSRREASNRVIAITSIALAAAAAIVVFQVPRLVQRDADAAIDEQWIRAAIAAAAVLTTVVGVVGFLRRRGSDAPRDRTAGAEQGVPVEAAAPIEPAAPVEAAAPRRAALMAMPMLALVIASVTMAWDSIGDAIDSHDQGWVQRGELEDFGPETVRALRSLPTGTTVMSDLAWRSSFRLMSLAPLYVVSSAPGHVANTPENRLEERYDVVDEWQRSWEMPVAERRAVLRRWRVGAVLVRKAPAFERVQRIMSTYLSNDFVVVSEDEWFTLYERRGLRR